MLFLEIEFQTVNSTPSSSVNSSTTTSPTTLSFPASTLGIGLHLNVLHPTAGTTMTTTTTNGESISRSTTHSSSGEGNTSSTGSSIGGKGGKKKKIKKSGYSLESPIVSPLIRRKDKKEISSAFRKKRFWQEKWGFQEEVRCHWLRCQLVLVLEPFSQPSSFLFLFFLLSSTIGRVEMVRLRTRCRTRNGRRCRTVKRRSIEYGRMGEVGGEDRGPTC